MKTKNAATRRGLLSGGNWIIDQVKIIDVYPQPEQLGNILGQSQGTGGGPYNVLINLAKSGVDFPLLGTGLVGKDALGEQILAHCAEHKIDARFIKATDKAPTSHTDVMTEKPRAGGHFFMRAAQMRCGRARGLISKSQKREFFISRICCCWMRWTNQTQRSGRKGRACWRRHRRPV